MTYHDKDDYGDVRRYINELLGRPVFTHELAAREIREKAKPDLYKLCGYGVDGTEGGN